MNLPRAAAGTATSRLVAYAIALATGILIARALGPKDRGTYAVLSNAVGILQAIGLLGIESANLYYAARKHNISGLFTNSLAIGLSTGAIVAIAFLLLFSFTKERLFPGIPFYLAAVATAGLPLALLYSDFSGILWGLSRIRALNILSIVGVILQLFAVVLAILLLRLGVLELLIIILLLGIFNIAALTLLLGQTPTPRLTISLDWGLMRRMVGFSGAAYGANLFAMIAARLDVLLLNIFVGGATVGHYAVAVTVAQAMLLVPQSIQRVLFVQFSGSSADEANRLIPLASRMILALMAGIALVAGLFSTPAVRLVLGAEYAPTARLFVLLLPGVVAVSLLGITSSYLSGRGRPDLPMRAALVILITVVTLDLILIPRIGATGAAIATSIAYIIGATFQLVIVLKWSKTSLWEVLLLRPQDLRYLRTYLFARNQS